MTLRLISCLGPITSLPTYCLAQDRGSAEDQEACTPEAFRLCTAEVPDETRVVACLKGDAATLSQQPGRHLNQEPDRK